MLKEFDQSVIQREEWDFSDVAAEDLEICVIYEYARECASFVGYQLYRKLDSRSQGIPEEEIQLFKDVLSLAKAKSFDIEIFLGRYYNTDFGYARLYDVLKDSVNLFSLPWSQLRADSRAYFSELAKSRKDFYPPLKPAYVLDLEKLWLENSKEVMAARLRYKDTKYDDDDFSELYEETKPLVSEPGYEAEPHGATVVAFEVDFKRHNNAAIRNAFLTWLEKNRPFDCPEPTFAGKKRSDLKHALTCLGVMRLLHRFTFDQIDQSFPAVWESKQFAMKKWFDENKWYEARRKSMKIYHEVFPFLDDNEKPLSYQTKGSLKRQVPLSRHVSRK